MKGQRPKVKPIDRLMMAMDACARARGNASWTQGYRARFERDHGHEGTEQDRLRRRENLEWEWCGEAEKSFRRLALKLLREASSRSSSEKAPAKKVRDAGRARGKR